jgi:bifunctional DNA-binding transcriptional regulator/antitoxin component of YhaV-PrlF toxin-antitoxin module
LIYRPWIGIGGAFIFRSATAIDRRYSVDMQVVLSTRGRFTVPISIRRQLKLHARDWVNIEMIGGKKIRISRAKASRKTTK